MNDDFVLPGPNRQPMPIAVFPLVTDDQFCGEWKPRLDIN